jgi:hypothetical protein
MPLSLVRSLTLLTVCGLLCGRIYAENQSGKSDQQSFNRLNLSNFGTGGRGGDDTQLFNRALAEASRLGRPIEIPVSKRPYRVSPLYLRANLTVLIDAGVTIEALPGFSDGQKLINIADVKNVQLIGYGSFLKMFGNANKANNYRHCISIVGSSFVAVKGITCVTPGGDGIYVSRSDRAGFSQDVSIEDVKVEKSTGSGLRVVSAKNLAVRRCEFLGGRGTEKSPEIQLYPDRPDARLEDIRIEDSLTRNSAGDGIKLVLNHLNKASTPVRIIVSNHRDISSEGSSYSGVNDPSDAVPVRGEILFQNCRSENAREYGAVLSFWNGYGAKAVFTGLTVINPNRGGSNINNVAVAVKRGGGGHGPIGNVEFTGATILDNRPKPLLDYYFGFVDFSGVGIRNVVFRDAVQLAGASHKQPLGLYQGQGLEEIERADDPKLTALWQAAEQQKAASGSRSP